MKKTKTNIFRFVIADDTYSLVHWIEWNNYRFAIVMIAISSAFRSNNICLRLHTYGKSTKSFAYIFYFPFLHRLRRRLHRPSVFHSHASNRIRFTSTFCKVNHSNSVWFWWAVARHDLERFKRERERNERENDRKIFRYLLHRETTYSQSDSGISDEWNESSEMCECRNANVLVPGRPQKVSIVWKCLWIDSISSSLFICMRARPTSRAYIFGMKTKRNHFTILPFSYWIVRALCGLLFSLATRQTQLRKGQF